MTHGTAGIGGDARFTRRNPARLVRILLSLLALMAAPLLRPLQAAPVAGEEFELAQPDGSLVHTRIWGDEFYQVVESMDGFTLVRDPATQVICYASLSADGLNLLSTGIRVDRATRAPLGLPRHLRIAPEAANKEVQSARARFLAGQAHEQGKLPRGVVRAPASTGNAKGICLIVDFSDSTGTITRDEVDRYCNQIGYTGYGNSGSVRDYFRAVSAAKLDYTNYVPPVYYRALKPKTYYDNPAEAAGPKARELVLEALAWLDAQGFDFSQYDSNNDGMVDGVNCFYAGTCSSGWSKGLWPHAWSAYFSADGKYTSNYQISYMGSALRIRTFCHENGHMLCGWPDLYDYGNQSNGIGQYCLMGYGGSDTNPVEPCPYMKITSNWATVVTLDQPRHKLQAPWSGNVIYRYPKPGAPNEYYAVNNLQKTGRGSAFPDAGLAVWHVDTYGSNDNEAMTSTSHYRVTLVQADGKWDLEKKNNYGDSSDLFDAASTATVSDSTIPNTKWWSTAPSGFKIQKVSTSQTTMTFTFGNPPPPHVVQVTSAHANGWFPAGEAVAVKVEFDTSVTVTGFPRLMLNARGGGAPAAYASGSGSTVLTFNFVAATGDAAADLDCVSAFALELNGGTITDSLDAATAADLALPLPGAPGSLAANKAIGIDTGAPAATASVSDATRAGTTSLAVPFSATDSGLSGVARVRLWAKAPGAGALTDAGIEVAAASGTLVYPSAATDGAYGFAVQAFDQAGNSSGTPSAPTVTILLNTAANSTYTQTYTGGGAPMTFPMTDDLDATLTLTGGTAGGTVTVSRTTPRGAVPAQLRLPGRLVDERLDINASGLGAFTARLDWAFDPAGASGLGALPVDRAFRVSGGIVTQELPVSRTVNVATVDGITGFSTWLIGNGSAVPVEVSAFGVE